MKVNYKTVLYCLFLFLLILMPNQIYASENKIKIIFEETEHFYSTFQDAIAAVPDNIETTLYLEEDVEIGSAVTIPSNKNIIIDGNNQYTITYLKKSETTWYTGQLFNIKPDAYVVFQNLTIDGQNNWSLDNDTYQQDIQVKDPVTNPTKYVTSESDKPKITANVINNNGNLIINNITIKNVFSSSEKYLIYASAATTVIRDSKIIHNANNGGGLVIYQIGSTSVTTIEGNTLISDNFATGNGGLFRPYQGSKIEMNGGKISNNKAVNSNGVVVMTYNPGSKFILNGGEISYNEGIAGKNNGRNAPIYVHSGSSFIMNGGSIVGNRGQATGGIDAPGRANSYVELNGGLISQNIAANGADHQADIFLADYNLVLGENMVIEGNAYISGDVVNNGIIKGDLTLNLGTNTQNALTGTGSVTGDLVLNYKGDVPPTIGDDVTVGGNIKIANVDQYTVIRYEYNGGVDQEQNERSKYTIEIGSEPPIPVVTRDGHTFLGWYSRELTVKWEETPITQDTTVYAKWQINDYKLTWVIDGKETTEILTYGDEISLPEAPVKEGYIFHGWQNYEPNMTMPGRDLTLTAIFKLPNEDIVNPETGDNVIKYFVGLIVSSFILIMTSVIYFKRKNI